MKERFPSECRKAKTKVITLANHKAQRQYSEPIKTRGVRGKTRVDESRLVFALLLIG